MKTISQWIKEGEQDRPVWSAQIRERLAHEADCVPLVIRLLCPDGQERDFSCRLPYIPTEKERALALEWFSAQLYNMLALYSAKQVTVFYPEGQNGVEELLREGIHRFTTVPGYQKLYRIARRVTGEKLRFDLRCVTELPQVKKPVKPAANISDARFAGRLSTALQCASVKSGCGIDVGGTDIKLAASWKGRLIAVKEYDWNPSAFTTAEQLLNPILSLAALMAACLTAATNRGELPAEALERTADEACMAQAVENIQAEYGGLLKFDSLGLSFPDIVIHDRILSGECSKTMGIWNNHSLDYDREMKKIAGLNELLSLYASQVRVINDGHMAAFTTAAEHFAGGEAPHGAICAHSLGTGLGSGWLSPEGNVPLIPFECSKMVFDLGSFRAKALGAKDIRSVPGVWSGLPFSAKYLGQAAAFRLVWADEPELIEEFVEMDGDVPVMKLSPKDMRKPCLQKIMDVAAAGDETACRVFRQIGIALGYMTQEVEFLRPTGTAERTMYGRLVKNPTCFALLQQGFESVCPTIRLIAADESLACSGLMRQLAEFPNATVAQFAQAVGAIEYAFY